LLTADCCVKRRADAAPLGVRLSPQKKLSERRLSADAHSAFARSRLILSHRANTAKMTRTPFVVYRVIPGFSLKINYGGYSIVLVQIRTAFGVE